MRAYGNTGSAVTQTNEPVFRGFATHSGRDIITDLERAHARTSPIVLSAVPQPVRRIAPRTRTYKPTPPPPHAARVALPIHSRIIELHNAGKTPAQIAPIVGLVDHTVRNHLRADGLTPNRTRPDWRSKYPEIAAYVYAGHNIRETCRHFGVVKDTVITACRDNPRPDTPAVPATVQAARADLTYTARRMTAAGFSPTEIAAYAQVSDAAVTEALADDVAS